MLDRVCARPELAPLIEEQPIRVAPELSWPYRVSEPSGAITLCPVALADEITAAVTLREALEWALLVRRFPSPAPGARLAHAVVATHAAMAYAAALAPGARGPYASLHAAERDERSVAARLAAHCLAHSAARFGLSRTGAALAPRALEQAAGALHLAVPVEQLLVRGGDGRIRVDPCTGLSPNGCSATPRRATLTFSSCTASSPSPRAFAAAEQLRRRMLFAALEPGGSAPRIAFGDEIRRGVAAALGLTWVPGAEVVLFSSGTDAELLPVVFAGLDPRPLLNVVIAPDEVGSGTLLAVAGRHFSELTPTGTRVELGARLALSGSGPVEVRTIEIRDDAGSLLAPTEIDRRVMRVVRRALTQGRRVVLHVVSCSKTGAAGPSPAAVEALSAESPGSVIVVVDATQMRTEPAALAAFLRRGFFVIVSGSKFFEGPPFSGAVLVPPTAAERLARIERAPADLAQYLTRADVPASWTSFRASLVEDDNAGLLLRWAGALAEMRGYLTIEPRIRLAVLRAISRAALRAIWRFESLAPLDPPLDWCGDDAAFVPTIFSLGVRVADGTGGVRRLGIEEARAMQAWLNRDATPRLPARATPRERVIAARICHVGEPVKIGEHERGALQIALGAPLIERIAANAERGVPLSDLVQREIADLESVLEKIDLLARCWPVSAAARVEADSTASDPPRSNGLVTGRTTNAALD